MQLRSLMGFFTSLLEGSDDEDENQKGGAKDDDDRLSRSTTSTSSRHVPHTPPIPEGYPGQILRVPFAMMALVRASNPAAFQKAADLPPAGMQRRPPKRPSEKSLRRENSDRASLPGPAMAGKWRPGGCGCWLDKSRLLQKVKRGHSYHRPACVLTPCQLHMLVDSLPAAVRWSPWELLFSTDEHGFCMRTLKENAAGETSMMLVISTVENDVLGAYLTAAPPKAAHQGKFVGSGEMYVWYFDKGRLRIFRCSGENKYYMTCCGSGGFGIGGGSGGVHALYIENTLFRGRTGMCPTFGSCPLIAESAGLHETKFEIASLELWTIGGRHTPSVPSDFTYSMANEETPEMRQLILEVTNPTEAFRKTPSPSPSDALSESPRDAAAALTCTWHLTDPNHHVCCLHPY